MRKNQEPLYKQCIHYYYFHKAYNNDANDIRDIGFQNEYCEDGEIKDYSIDVSDPFYLDKDGNPIWSRDDIDNIEYITLGICRPAFRKDVFSQIMTHKVYNRCIFHFYIKKGNQGIYVCSGLLKKATIRKTHKATKAELAGILKRQPGYLNQNKEYVNYSYKKSIEADDPLLVFSRLRIKKPPSEYSKSRNQKSPYLRQRKLMKSIQEGWKYEEYCQNYIREHDIPSIINPSNYNQNWQTLMFKNWKKFDSFKQTQNSCPFSVRNINIHE